MKEIEDIHRVAKSVSKYRLEQIRTEKHLLIMLITNTDDNESLIAEAKIRYKQLAKLYIDESMKKAEIVYIIVNHSFCNNPIILKDDNGKHFKSKEDAKAYAKSLELDSFELLPVERESLEKNWSNI